MREREGERERERVRVRRVEGDELPSVIYHERMPLHLYLSWRFPSEGSARFGSPIVKEMGIENCEI